MGGGVGKGDLTTYFGQIVNEPHKIIVLKVWHGLFILLPVKYIAKLVLEVG